MQELEGRDRFPVRRVVESASWLTTGSRGQGYGKEMRAGVLRLAFEHLGALVAETEAWHDNAASLGVSAGLGYEPNGESIHVMGDRRDRMLAMRLTAEWWREREHLFPASIDGLESSRFLFGV
jgi:RimJ/RimL family protein N-acetyltransferase